MFVLQYALRKDYELMQIILFLWMARHLADPIPDDENSEMKQDNEQS